jgi:hypothetical protein
VPRRITWLTLLTAALIALPTGGIPLIASAAGATHKHHKRHHKKHHKTGGALCKGFASGQAAPNENGVVQFQCRVTVKSFSVTTNKTVVAANQGGQRLPFAISPPTRFSCKLTGPHSFSCSGPAVQARNIIRAAWREQEGCAGLHASVTVNGNVSPMQTAATCQ